MLRGEPGLHQGRDSDHGLVAFLSAPEGRAKASNLWLSIWGKNLSHNNSLALAPAPQRGVAPSEQSLVPMTHSRGSIEGDATEHLFLENLHS